MMPSTRPSSPRRTTSFDLRSARPFTNLVASGTHTVGVQAEGIVGRCNTGYLGS